MPALRNMRHEKFCRELVKGTTQSKAYQAAGYRASRADTLRFNASRLKTSENVSARLQELAAMAATKAAVTVESISQELDECKRLAFQEGQASAAVAAVTAKAKLFGLVINKSESGQPGEFSNLATPQDVIDKVRNELGDEVAETLAKAFGLEPAPDQRATMKREMEEAHAMSASFEAQSSKQH